MLVTVARYTFPYEAQISWSKLDAAGIPAYIGDEHTINMDWLYSNALGGVRIQVPRQFEQMARELLETDLEPELIEQQGCDSIRCPKCQSSDTEYHQFGKRFAFLVFLGIDFPLYPVKEGIRCRQCGAKTPLEPVDQPNLTHGAE
ncbi:DUF2007 domain-containing protein [Motiliproteus coralliicola]|uniref:DUF2007 domain-containing protein n=1 Tax=Motiliproteus coralliicola TaxID=2283196 RepID=A0A369WS37_9GAMM|nr:DUF2007 domain-containing protein [Motiliproteus coralliicola]RDE24930.1 DUF2007 domain-containing protein [Motiliproteus coralliicola]